jgi:hypothetical protein
MFYLFSSDYEPRFKRNVLDVLCYPENHIFRFRYHIYHVPPEIQKWSTGGELPAKLKEVGTKGLSIYAETAGEIPNKTFHFYPLREVEIIRIQVLGNIYYIDMRLGRFINYFSEGQDKAHAQLKKLQDAIKQTSFYPLPQLTKKPDSEEKQGLTWRKDGQLGPYDGAPGFTNQGYFFLNMPSAGCGIKYALGQSGNPRAWESVVEILSAAPSMQSSLFYLVEGFYRKRKKYLNLFGAYEESLIEPKDDDWDTRYPLKMGTSVILKLLFFRSSKAPRISDQSLEVKTDGDAFAGFSQKQIPILSRYNEERILIACKRVFDSIFAPIVIELREPAGVSDGTSLGAQAPLKSAQVETAWGTIEFKPKNPAPSEAEILAPHPFLLTQVTASKGLIAATLIFLVLASFFLFMSPDYIQQIGWSQFAQTYFKPVGDSLVRNGPVYTQVSKVLGAVFSLVAGFLAFRKLPLGK